MNIGTVLMLVDIASVIASYVYFRRGDRSILYYRSCRKITGDR